MYSFGDEAALSSHNDHSHNHRCAACKESFRTPEGRDQHVEARHTISCIHCPAKFKFQSLLLVSYPSMLFLSIVLSRVLEVCLIFANNAIETYEGQAQKQTSHP